MSGRFGQVRRSFLLFLLLLTLPLSLYAQSRHFKDDKTKGVSADCVATTPGAGPVSVPDEPIPGGPGDYATIFWGIQWDGPLYTMADGTCHTLGWPRNPISAAIDPACTAAGNQMLTNEYVIACQHGNAVAARAARTFCLNALRKGVFGVTVDGSNGPTAVDDCNELTDANGNPTAATPPGGPVATFRTVHILPTAGGCGFQIIAKNRGGADGLDFKGDGPGGCPSHDIGVLGGHNMVLTSSVDMLHSYFVQIDPQGQSTGTLTFKAWRKGNTGPTQDCSFTVPITTNLTTLHNSICDGFNITCASLGANAAAVLRQDSHSRFKNLYPVNNMVEISNAGDKLEVVEVSSTNGVPQIYSETSDQAIVPVLNPWGVALLILTLLLSSLWMVRRHRLLNRS
jgi:hypothetical protein